MTNIHNPLNDSLKGMVIYTYFLEFQPCPALIDILLMIYALYNFLIFASSHILLLPYFHISICPDFQASPIQAKDFSSNSLKYLFRKMLWGAVCIFTSSNSFKTKGNKILQSDGFNKRNHAHPPISIWRPSPLITSGWYMLSGVKDSMAQEEEGMGQSWEKGIESLQTVKTLTWFSFFFCTAPYHSKWSA